jgi:hypothetical protein
MKVGGEFATKDTPEGAGKGTISVVPAKRQMLNGFSR